MKIDHISYLTFLLIVAAGCEEHTLSDAYSFNAVVNRVDIQLDSADLQVTASEGDTSTVDFDVDYFGSKPTISATVVGDTLRVRMKCRLSCDGDFVVTVPKNVASKISVDSGNMDIADLLGSANLNVDSGNIHLRDLSGNLNLSADSGSIKGSVNSSVCAGHEDSGNLNLHFNETPSHLDVSADSGNVTLEVPAGPYDIRTSVDSGHVRIRSVTDDSAAPSAIYADVDSGNITIAGY